MQKESLESIKKILESLLMEEEILAAMVALNTGQNIFPDQKLLKIKSLGLWNTISVAVSDAFSIATKFSAAGFDKIYIELGEFEVIFFLINPSSLLICVVPSLANKGLLEVEIENARRDLKQFF